MVLRSRGFLVLVLVNWWSFQLVVPSQGLRQKSAPYSYQFIQQQFQDYFETEGNRLLCIMLGLCATTSSYFQNSHPQSRSLLTIHEWRNLEFDYPTPADRQRAIQDKSFIPGNAAPIDVDVRYADREGQSNKIFLVIPRFQEGIPVTLGTVTDRTQNGNPIIAPYPSWSWHTDVDTCKADRLVTVFRVQLDECGRLWVLDSGSHQDGNDCPPQILAFDVKTDRLLHRYEIPHSQFESRSVFTTPSVEIIPDGLDQCAKTYVYMADCQTYSIVVYDVQAQRSWRATDKTMYPYPSHGTYDILGDKFDLMDGILGMALSPPGDSRKLFYHAMASGTENWVYTADLRNRSRFNENPESSPEVFHTLPGLRSSQSAAEAIDSQGIMYFGLHSEVTLNCWNIATTFGPENIDTISNDQDVLQFLSGVKVIKNRRGEEELWLVSSRFQKIMTGSLNTNEVNFRVLAGKTEDLLSGSKCRQRSRPPTQQAFRPIRPTRRPGSYGFSGRTSAGDEGERDNRTRRSSRVL